MKSRLWRDGAALKKRYALVGGWRLGCAELRGEYIFLSKNL